MLRVTVGAAGGPEAAARTARYAALDAARCGDAGAAGPHPRRSGRDGAAGPGPGSGAAPSPACASPTRPGTARCWGYAADQTHAACAELGIAAWDDPHNHDRRFTRVRLRREVLPLLEDVLGGGVAEALARTATALREDTEALDAIAEHSLAAARRGGAQRRGAGAAARHGAPPGDPRLAARRRRERAQRQADPGGRRAGHRVARQGGAAVGSDQRHRRLFAARRDGALVLYFEAV